MSHPSWTSSAIDVVQNACEHYGGMHTWQALRCVRLKPDRLSGLVPWLKGYARSFEFRQPFEIMPHERRVKFLGYPDEEHVGVFEDGAVRLERAADGVSVAGSKNHRQSFGGLAKNRRWAPLDAIYFFGYALSHYHALPFTLLEGRLLSLSARGVGSARRDVLEIELPSDLPTHSARQRFYFDRSGRITRHDYHAEIIGFWARGAHFWRRETVCNGFRVSLERHVVARLGTTTLPITALHATFNDAEVELAPRADSAEAAASAESGVASPQA